MNNIFDLEIIDKSEGKKINPQILAFVGDGVYTLFVRNKLALNFDGKSGELHKLTTHFVKASGQSSVISKLMPLLSEDESAVFKRGRNYKTHSIAKNATVIDYKRATGFEAVLGYLYLTGQQERLIYLLNICTTGDDNEN